MHKENFNEDAKHNKNNVVCFYDRKIRLWTAFYVDKEGNQISNTGYGMSKTLAIKDTDYGT